MNDVTNNAPSVEDNVADSLALCEKMKKSISQVEDCLKNPSSITPADSINILKGLNGANYGLNMQGLDVEGKPVISGYNNNSAKKDLARTMQATVGKAIALNQYGKPSFKRPLNFATSETIMGVRSFLQDINEGLMPTLNDSQKEEMQRALSAFASFQS